MVFIYFLSHQLCLRPLGYSGLFLFGLILFKFATTLDDLLLTELMLQIHFSHAKQMYSQTTHLSHQLKLCMYKSLSTLKACTHFYSPLGSSVQSENQLNTLPPEGWPRFNTVLSPPSSINILTNTSSTRNSKADSHPITVLTQCCVASALKSELVNPTVTSLRS